LNQHGFPVTGFSAAKVSNQAQFSTAESYCHFRTHLALPEGSTGFPRAMPVAILVAMMIEVDLNEATQEQLAKLPGIAEPQQTKLSLPDPIHQ
jgi:hypothetical protein